MDYDYNPMTWGLRLKGIEDFPGHDLFVAAMGATKRQAKYDNFISYSGVTTKTLLKIIDQASEGTVNEWQIYFFNAQTEILTIKVPSIFGGALSGELMAKIQKTAKDMGFSVSYTHDYPHHCEFDDVRKAIQPNAALGKTDNTYFNGKEDKMHYNVVVEVGAPQSTDKHKQRADWWIQKSQAMVMLVITVSIPPEADKFEFNTWEAPMLTPDVKPGMPVPGPTIHASSAEVSRDSQGEWHGEGALKLSFINVSLRHPEKNSSQRDLHITGQELKDMVERAGKRIA